MALKQIDPGIQIAALAPGVGRTTVPHIVTFSGITSTLAKVYRQPDEALRQSVHNAAMMRRDPMIMGPLLARQQAVALLPWSIVPEDEKNSELRQVASSLEDIVRRTPRLTEYFRNLMEAIWYGKQAAQHGWGKTRDRSGKAIRYIQRWVPMLGDKLVFRFDDGKAEFDPDQIGIKVTPAWARSNIILGEPDLEYTSEGSAVFLKRWQRTRIAVHKHLVMDGDYIEPWSAGMIHGVGLRHFLYWCWFQKQETLAQLTEVVERTGMGFTIYYYPAGNERAQAEVREIAEQQPNKNQIIMPFDPSNPDAYRVEQIPPNTGGITALSHLIDDYFGNWIIRFILGQTLSMRADATGMGSGLSDLQKDSFLQIVRYDATNLEETLTTDLVQPLLLFNFPKYRNTRFFLKIATESSVPAEKLQALNMAWSMGAKIRTQDILDMVGAATPGDDDDTVWNPGVVGAMMQIQQEQAKAAPPQQQGGGGGLEEAYAALLGGAPAQQSKRYGKGWDPEVDDLPTSVERKHPGIRVLKDKNGWHATDTESGVAAYVNDDDAIRYTHGDPVDAAEDIADRLVAAVREHQEVVAKASRPVKPVHYSQYESPEFKSWFGESRAVDEGGDPLTVYHGTTHDFEEFSDERGNHENDLGIGHYFTTNADDAAANYHSEGSDLQNRIENKYDEIRSYEPSDEEVLEMASPHADRIFEILGEEGDLGELYDKDPKKFIRAYVEATLRGREDKTLPIHLSVSNPAIINRSKKYKGTVYGSLYEPYDPEDPDSDIVESDFANTFANAFAKAGFESGVNGRALLSEFLEQHDGDEVTATDLYDFIKKYNGDEDLYNHDDGGHYAGGQFLGALFRNLGHDAIKLTDVSQHYPRMEHTRGTDHWIVWDPRKIKHATENVGTWGSNDPRFRHAEDEQPVRYASEEDRDSGESDRLESMKEIHELYPEAQDLSQAAWMDSSGSLYQGGRRSRPSPLHREISEWQHSDIHNLFPKKSPDVGVWKTGKAPSKARSEKAPRVWMSKTRGMMVVPATAEGEPVHVITTMGMTPEQLKRITDYVSNGNKVRVSLMDAYGANNELLDTSVVSNPEKLIEAHQSFKRLLPRQTDPMQGIEIPEAPEGGSSTVPFMLGGERVLPEGQRNMRGVYKSILSESGVEGRAPLDIIKNKKDQETMADSLAHEAIYALSKDGNAVQWYGDSLEQSIDTLSEIPEPQFQALKLDGNERKMFKVFLALTSNMTSVPANMRQAVELYDHWYKTGQVKPDFKLEGTASASFERHKQLLTALLERYNGDIGELDKFLSGKFKVSDLKGVPQLQGLGNSIYRYEVVVPGEEGEEEQRYQYAGQQAASKLADTLKSQGLNATVERIDTGKKKPLSVSGEHQSTILPGAAVFGPKLGSFYNNLNGNFDTTTMDRWLMRTINRHAGTVVDFSEDLAKKHAAAMLQFFDPDYLASLTKEERDAQQIAFRQAMQDAGIVGPNAKRSLISELKKIASKGAVGENSIAALFAGELHAALSRSDYKDKRPYYQVGKMMDLNINGLNESPKGGAHRKAIREVMSKVRDRVLKATGRDMPEAKLQALLWYYEKDLVRNAGLKLSRQAGTDFKLEAQKYVDRRLERRPQHGKLFHAKQHGFGSGDAQSPDRFYERRGVGSVHGERAGVDSQGVSRAIKYANTKTEYDPSLWNHESIGEQQEHQSKLTSLSQVPGTLKAVERAHGWQEGTINADIGGGRFDHFTNELGRRGVTNYIYDPFNRSKEHNHRVASAVANGRAHTATVNNVLNVIKEPEIREHVIKQAANAIKDDGKAYFLMHEGTPADQEKGSRVTKSRDGVTSWQEFRKAHTYIPEIEKHFGKVSRIPGSSVLVAMDPIKHADQPQRNWVQAALAAAPLVIDAASSLSGGGNSEQQATPFTEAQQYAEAPPLLTPPPPINKPPVVKPEPKAEPKPETAPSPQPVAKSDEDEGYKPGQIAEAANAFAIARNMGRPEKQETPFLWETGDFHPMPQKYAEEETPEPVEAETVEPEPIEAETVEPEPVETTEPEPVESEAKKPRKKGVSNPQQSGVERLKEKPTAAMKDWIAKQLPEGANRKAVDSLWKAYLDQHNSAIDEYDRHNMAAGSLSAGIGPERAAAITKELNKGGDFDSKKIRGILGNMGADVLGQSLKDNHPDVLLPGDPTGEQTALMLLTKKHPKQTPPSKKDEKLLESAKAALPDSFWDELHAEMWKPPKVTDEEREVLASHVRGKDGGKPEDQDIDRVAGQVEEQRQQGNAPGIVVNKPKPKEVSFSDIASALGGAAWGQRSSVGSLPSNTPAPGQGSPAGSDDPSTDFDIDALESEPITPEEEQAIAEDPENQPPPKPEETERQKWIRKTIGPLVPGTFTEKALRKHGGDWEKVKSEHDAEVQKVMDEYEAEHSRATGLHQTHVEAANAVKDLLSPEGRESSFDAIRKDMEAGMSKDELLKKHAIPIHRAVTFVQRHYPDATSKDMPTATQSTLELIAGTHSKLKQPKDMDEAILSRAMESLPKELRSNQPLDTESLGSWVRESLGEKATDEQVSDVVNQYKTILKTVRSRSASFNKAASDYRGVAINSGKSNLVRQLQDGSRKGMKMQEAKDLVESQAPELVERFKRFHPQFAGNDPSGNLARLLANAHPRQWNPEAMNEAILKQAIRDTRPPEPPKEPAQPRPSEKFTPYSDDQRKRDELSVMRLQGITAGGNGRLGKWKQIKITDPQTLDREVKAFEDRAKYLAVPGRLDQVPADMLWWQHEDGDIGTIFDIKHGAPDFHQVIDQAYAQAAGSYRETADLAKSFGFTANLQSLNKETLGALNDHVLTAADLLGMDMLDIPPDEQVPKAYEFLKQQKDYLTTFLDEAAKVGFVDPGAEGGPVNLLEQANNATGWLISEAYKEGFRPTKEQLAKGKQLSLAEGAIEHLAKKQAETKKTKEAEERASKRGVRGLINKMGGPRKVMGGLVMMVSIMMILAALERSTRRG